IRHKGSLPNVHRRCVMRSLRSRWVRTHSRFVVALVLGCSVCLAAAAQSPDPDIPQKDLLDIWRDIRNKPSATAEPNERGLAIAPVIGWNPTFGATIGAAAHLSQRRGNASTTRLSSGIASLSYSTKKQMLLAVRFSAFLEDNRWFLEGDNRFYISGQDVYGLGTDTPKSAAVGSRYNFIRVHEKIYRRLAKDGFAGGGLLVDCQSDVRAASDDPGAWSQSAYLIYSREHGLPETSQQGAGLRANLLVDKRDGEIDPRGGWMATAVYRTSWNGFLGADSSWQSMHAELRGYAPVRARSRIAGWFFTDVTSGVVPYFDLPATVMDMYQRSSRGYQEGRYRGERAMYGEIEYRTTLTRNGLIGAVAFANAITVTNLEAGEHLFDSLAPGLGGGLRVLLSKKSRTNLCVDFSAGKQGAHGVYFAIQDAF